MMNPNVGTAALLVVIVALVSAGCSKEKGQGVAEESSAFHQPILETLKGAGLKPEGFEKAAARPYKAQGCFRGEVDQLDVLICQYGDAASAKKNQGTLEAFVSGAMSGAVRVKATTALAVADRQKKDIKGKKINQVLAAFIDKK